MPTAAFADWYAKHPGHAGVGFDWPQRTLKPSWVDRLRACWDWFRRPAGGLAADPAWGRVASLGLALPPAVLASLLPNADVKVAYGATTTPTMTLASLAASSTLLAGRESTAVDNGASNKYLDQLLAGNYRQAATNTQAGRIRTAVVGNRDDTPSWPDVFDGTDSTETVTTQAMYDSICRIASEIVTAATANAINPFGPVAIAGLFGGVLPDQFVLFTSHNAQTTTNAWSATEADHAVRLTPVYVTVI